jgi:sugar lactone lactonase YvrE
MQRNGLRIFVALPLAISACGAPMAPPMSSTFAEDASPVVRFHGAPRADEAIPSPRLVATLDRIVSGVVRDGDRSIVAMPRWFAHDHPALVEIRDDGTAHAWPPSDGPSITSVNGITTDARRRLWVLDNARVDLGPPRDAAPALLLFDLDTAALLHRFELPPGAIAPSTFLNDLAVDLDHARVYITETGLGGRPALLVYDLIEDRIDRVLDDHPSLRADPDHTMHVGTEPATVDVGGERRPWRVGANPIALASDASVVAFGAMSAETLWGIPPQTLFDDALDDDARATQIHPLATRGSTDGMAAAPDGRWVLTDLEASGLRVILPDGTTQAVLTHPDAVFPVAVHVETIFDANGPRYRAWFTSSELHRIPPLHGGLDRRTGAYHLWVVDLPPWPSAPAVP